MCGELEITNLNKMYLEDGSLSAVTLGCGYTWLDTGTMESLYEAGEFVRAAERAQDTPVAVLEEIVCENSWVGTDALFAAVNVYITSVYDAQLRKMAIGILVKARGVQGVIRLRSLRFYSRYDNARPVRASV